MKPFTAPLNTPPPRHHPLPGNVLLHAVRLDSSKADPPNVQPQAYTPVTDLDQAVLVSSQVDGADLHRPVLDIDLPVTALPSSTPGHCHLLIDHPMSWSDYVRLLEVLAEVGLVEPGYVSGSIARGFTGVRVPWIRKGDPLPALPIPEVDMAVMDTIAAAAEARRVAS